MSAGDALHHALAEITDRGIKVACATDSHLWISESDKERAVAIARCHGCPVSALCRDMAIETKATWAVYAAVDYSPTKKPSKRKKKAA